MRTIRRFWTLILVFAIVAVMPAATMAQQNAPGTPVTLTGARGDPGVNVSTTATTGTTLTLTPAVGEFVYVYSVHVSNCAGASAVTAAAVTTITTTAIGGGTTPAWTLGSGVAAGLCTQVFTDTYPTGLKGNVAGTAVTFVTPTYATNQTVRLQVVWRSAP